MNYNSYDAYANCGCDDAYSQNTYAYSGYQYYDYYYNTYSYTYSYQATPEAEPKEVADDVSQMYYTTTYTYETPSNNYYGYQYGAYYSVEECTCGQVEWGDFFAWISDFFKWLSDLFSYLAGNVSN